MNRLLPIALLTSMVVMSSPCLGQDVPQSATPAPSTSYLPTPVRYQLPPPSPLPPGSLAGKRYRGGPIPAGYHVERRPITGLIIGGAAALALGVVATASYAGHDEKPKYDNEDMSVMIGPGLIVIGVALAAVGIAAGRQVLEEGSATVPPKSTPHDRDRSRVGRLVFAPAVGQNAAMLAARGVF